jgi:hypothetical protein
MLRAAALLATFLTGSGFAAWHVASTGCRPAAAVLLGDEQRPSAPSHDDRDCRVCASTHGTLVTPPVVHGAADADLRPLVARDAPAVSRDRSVAGPLGSRAPPSLS